MLVRGPSAGRLGPRSALCDVWCLMSDVYAWQWKTWAWSSALSQVLGQGIVGFVCHWYVKSLGRVPVMWRLEGTHKDWDRSVGRTRTKRSWPVLELDTPGNSVIPSRSVEPIVSPIQRGSNLNRILWEHLKPDYEPTQLLKTRVMLQSTYLEVFLD